MEVVSSGVYLVLKVFKYGDLELEWRIFFLKVEKIIYFCFLKLYGEYVFFGGRKIIYDYFLIFDVSCCIECYCILKEIFKEYFLIFKIFSLYYFKIIMFWVCEKYFEDFWESVNLVICFLGFFDDFFYCLVI